MTMLLALLLAQAVCPPQKLQAVRFTPGEVLQFKIDALGADVGSFEVSTRKPKPAGEEGALELTSRAKTSAFVSTNLGQYDGYAVAVVSPSFAPLHYREDVDEGTIHRASELDFPPHGGNLSVKASTNGEAQTIVLPAGDEVRDILSTLFVLRAQPLKPGSPICMEVYAGRKVWRLTGQVAAKEKIDTPLGGALPSVRIDAEAVRVDEPRTRRAAHVWVSDDARRLPLVAIGEMRGKTLRAQLYAVKR
jgi:hypothetical protein